MIRAGNEVEIQNPPSDGISAVKFGSWSDSLLLTSSWDSSVYLHDAIENRLRGKWDVGSPVLDCAFGPSSNDHAFAGSLDNDLLQLDLALGTKQTLGAHKDSVKCVSSCRATGLVFSASWDMTLAGWDTRTGGRVASMDLPGKAYSMDICQNLLVLAMSDRHIWLFDSRNMSGPMQKRESSLKYTTRCVRAFPSGEGYVCTSIEGRVAVDFVDPGEEAQRQKYAFKCHRAPVQGESGTATTTTTAATGMEKVYPVNATAFHPTYGTFATGGSDGIVNFWDRVNRKRIRQVPRYHSSIASLSFNRDGQLLAVASSYGWEEGELPEGHGGRHSVVVRSIEDADIKPKLNSR